MMSPARVLRTSSTAVPTRRTDTAVNRFRVPSGLCTTAATIPAALEHHSDSLRGSVPTRIELPPCLLDSRRAVFPTLDFSRVVFYLGIPRGVAGASGFTMCSGGPGADIRIYLKTYDPCSTATFVLVAHELVHALQIQGMVGGGRIPGSWVTYYLSHALRGGGRGGGRTNDLELEAYDFTNGRSSGGRGELRAFVDTHLGGAAPCSRAASGSPTSTPTSTTVRGQSYAEALTAHGTPTKTTSSVGHTWYSLLTWPATIIAGAFSVFGFSSTGGALGALGGIAAGAVTGGVVGALRRGPLGAVLGILAAAYAGGIVGGAIGWAVTPWRCPAAHQAFCRRIRQR